ncbi:MAG: Ig-like domain-containing protein [Bacteroidaceae bacterium]
MRPSPRTLFPLLAAMLAVACASIGNPDGGRYDEEPPVVVSCMPADKAVGVTKKKVSILFNEYVKLESANEKVVISPPQIETANVRAEGKRVKVDLFDSLQANTTYTIDFSDAIEDNNEGNPMGQYTYSFSTGEVIDTMEVSGTVLNAENLEPVKGMMVGLYPADSTFHDTLFTTVPLRRVSRTNGSGRFTIKGVKPGRYRTFALQDADGNFIFNQKSEMVAWDTTVVSTSCRPDIRMDTIWRDSTHYDSIRVVPYTHYYPDNIVLRAFKEEGQDVHLLKQERPVPDYFKLYFTAPLDTLPVIRGLNFNDSCLVVERSLKNDTLTYWVTDTTYSYMQDTLTFAITYLETDTLGQLVPRTDTLDLSPKETRAKQLKDLYKKIEDWEKDRAKRAKRSKTPLPPEENPFLKTFLTITPRPTGSIDPNQNLTLLAGEPIASVDTSMVRFFIKKDTLWVPEPFLFEPHELDRKAYVLYAEWKPQEQYRFEADSTAFRGVLGHVSRPVKQELKVKSLDEFGSLFVHVVGPSDSNIVVQLINRSDKPVREIVADASGQADFFYLKPGEYFLRCFIDRNGNGKWDTGSYAQQLHPEEVFYFPKPISVKAKWDIEQDWNLRSIPTEKQKPSVLVKQKADKKKDVRSRNKEREEELRKGKSGKSGNKQTTGSNITRL